MPDSTPRSRRSPAPELPRPRRRICCGTTLDPSTLPSPRIATGEVRNENHTIALGRLASRVLAEDIDVALRRRVDASRLGHDRRSTSVIDHDVRAGQIAELYNSGMSDTPPAPGHAGQGSRSRGQPTASIASIARSAVRRGELLAGQRQHRATSSAHVAVSMTTARPWERSNSRMVEVGWPLYQATNSVAAHELEILAGIPSCRSVLRPDAVEDRVVAPRSSRG